MKEVRQRKANTVWSHLYVNSKKTKQNKFIDKESKLVVAWVGMGVGGKDDGGTNFYLEYR